jgi:hypothetical protein
MKRKWISRALAACVVVAFIGGAHGAPADPLAARRGTQSYSFQTIDPPFGVAGVDMALQCLYLNDSSVMTAQYQAPVDSPNQHSAILLRGRWANIDVAGAITTGVTQASRRGQVALTYALRQDGPLLVALYDGRRMRRFPELPDYPGGILANGVNDRGQIAGAVVDAAGVTHGFVGDREAYEIFDYPGAIGMTTPRNLNNHGTTVGYYFLPDWSGHGFWYREGEFGAIDRPDSLGTFPLAINNAGVIVGVYWTATDSAGFVLERGRFTDFRVPNSTYTQPFFINDRGQVSGIYGDAAGIAHGFVATPARHER